MGAVTDALARSGGRGRRDGRHRRRGRVGRPAAGEVALGRRQAQGLRTARGATVLSPAARPPCSTGCSPRPVPAGRHRAGVEGAQLKVNMLLTRLPRLRDARGRPRGRLRRHLPHQRGLRPARGARMPWPRAGRMPDLPPCEIYCHSLSDRSILGPELRGTRRADADALRPAPAGPALPRRTTRPRRDGGPRGHAALAGLGARPSRSRTCCCATPDGQPVPRGQDAGRPRAGPSACPAATSSTASLQWPWAERPRAVGTWGVETVTRAGAARAAPAPAAAAASAASPATTRRRRSWPAHRRALLPRADAR